MGKNNKKKKNSFKDLQRKSKNLDKRQEGLKRHRKIVFGLSMLDGNQEESYKDWEDYKLLSKALSKFQGLSSMTVEKAKEEQILKIYGNEIPEGSTFKHPKHIPEAINWASIKIQGKVRVIGFLEENYIFQVVFLDKDHGFYPSKKKNT